MDKKQFLKELKEKLMCLPYDEREKALAYYEEYFDDAGEENEADVLNELGSVENIAREIIENSTSTIDSISRNKYYNNSNKYKNNYNGSQNYNNSREREYKSKNYNSENRYNSTKNNYSSYYNNDNDRNNYKYNYSTTPNCNEKNKSIGWIVAIIIICVLASPLLIGIIGLIIGIIGLIIGLIFSAFGLALSTIIGLFAVPVVGVAVIGKILFLIGKGIIGLLVLVILCVGIVKLIRYCKNKIIDKKNNY